jgi:DNA-binding NarL/FixJ family response regulator
MSKPSIRVMCVEDHRIVREGLALIINQEPDMKIVGSCATVDEAIELYRTLRPDVTLMDLRLPGANGADTIQAIRQEFRDARFVMLSTYVCDEEVYGALQAGAMAYLVKSVQRDELMTAIRKAAAGHRHIPPEVAARLADRVARSQLSAREIEVLRLLVSGRRNREIAGALEITEGTVKLHVSSILEKLGAEDRTEAVTVALQRGIVQLNG